MSQFNDAFISYGRADSKAFCVKLYHCLLKAGFKIWFDQNDIPLGVDFQEQINDGIDKAHNFLFVIAPHSVNSPYCLKEILLALKRNKRIIPLLHVEQISYDTWKQRYPQGTEADWEAYQAAGKHSSFPNMHPEIGKINWVYFREGQDDFEMALAGLIELVHRQENYVKKHTEILTKALEWEQNQKQTRYLLVAQERQDAEAWLQVRFKREQAPCLPTDLHCEFICESIKNGNNLMTQVFISYADEDKLMTEKIRRTLMREGITVWTNKTDIQMGTDFQKEIYRGIEGADNFVYLLSPKSLNSAYCQLELDHAFTYNKRVITLLIEQTDLEQVPEKVRALQFIDCAAYSLFPSCSLEKGNEEGEQVSIDDYQQKYPQAMDQLIHEIKQDASYYEQHKVLLVKAVKWEQQNRNPTILLRGYNLQQFQAWLKVAKTKTSHLPTPLQVEFLEESAKLPDQSSEVFVSYSRTDSDFARKLNEALQIQGKTTWFDQESIASGSDFQQEIYRGIENSDNFLFILSPRSINSPYCADEVEYAAKLNKRFITVLYRAIDVSNLHPELAKVQWIDFNRNNGDFYANFSELVRTLETDRDHVQRHTKFSQKALEWQEKGKDKDFLLRGNELAVALEWLSETQQKQKKPMPTPLQQEHIDKSYRHKDLQHKFLIARIATVFVLVTGSALFAGYKWGEATQLQREAAVRADTFVVQQKLNYDPAQALTLAIKNKGKLNQHPKRWKKVSYLIKSSLYQALASIYNRNQLRGHEDDVTAVTFSPDGKMIASSSNDNTVRLWHPQGYALATLIGHKGHVNTVVFSPDGQTIATGANDDTIRLWNSQGELQQMLIGHEGAVTSIVFSPDGKTIASSGTDQTVRLWNLQGELQQTLTGHEGAVSSIVFSPDGKTIASSSQDQTVRLWNLQGEDLATLQMDDGKITAIALSPDGKMVASGSDDNQVRLWDLSRRDQAPRIFPGHEDEVTAIALSPDGKMIASGSHDTTVRLWDLQGQDHKILDGHENEVNLVVFSPDGKTIASSSIKNTMRLWTIQGQELAALKGHEDKITSIAFSPDSQTIASSSHDNTVRLWEHPGYNRVPLIGHEEEVTAIAFSPDGQTIVSGSNDNTVRLWNLPTRQEKTLTGHEGTVYSVAFSPDGHTIASSSSDNTVRLWNRQGQLLQTLTGHTDGVTSVRFSPDGKTIASRSRDNTIRLWDLQGQLLQTLTGHEGNITTMAFSPDGKRIASGSEDKMVFLWDLSRPETEPQQFLGHEEAVTSVVFSPDGTRIASGSNDNTVRLWNLNRPQQEPRVFDEHEEGVTSVVFSLDGQRIASASRDNTVRLWAVKGNFWNRKGKALATLRGHEAPVRSVLFSPDGQMIVSGSRDDTVRLWTRQGQPLTTLKGHEGWITSVVFSPDGKMIASSSNDNTVRLWHGVNAEFWLKDACGRLQFHPVLVEAEMNQKSGNDQLEDAIIIDPEFAIKAVETCQNYGWEASETAEFLQRQGWALAQLEGDLDDAVETFKKAQALDKNVDVAELKKQVLPWAAAAQVQQAATLMQDKQGEDAIDIYKEARELDPTLANAAQKIAPINWYNLCWYGSLQGYAEEVITACQKAVELDPDNQDYRDSRGLARALTGKPQEAITDFEQVIQQLNEQIVKVDNSDTQNELVQKKSRRQSWVNDLRQGKNPFTDEVIKELFTD